MSVAIMMDLMSQADKEGITLSELIARRLTVEEMDKVQAELTNQLSENYRRIEEFMSTITVPSIEEILSGDESVRDSPTSIEESSV